ncbi:MAG TPA: hypothetical protein VKA55_01770 [Gammaproteobacteria bacterium]|nr:hypothetical protein [Gammaproteobacteria bacterium]
MPEDNDGVVSDLVLRLRALTQAGWRLGIPPEALDELMLARERLRFLMDKSFRPPAAYSPPPELNVTTPEELADALARLIREAADADAPPWATDLLRAAHSRLSTLLAARKKAAGGSRTPFRREHRLGT